jgi:hypothetical protein
MLNLTSNNTITESECSYRSSYPLWSPLFVLGERQSNISIWSATYLNHCCVLSNNVQIMDHIKLINAQQAATVYSYGNTKGKLHRTIAAFWFNKMYRLNHLTPKYINSTVNLVCFYWYHYCIYLNNARIMDYIKLILTTSLVPCGRNYPTYSVLFRICYVDFQLCSQKMYSLQNYLSPVDKITASCKGWQCYSTNIKVVSSTATASSPVGIFTRGKANVLQ